MSTDKPSGFTFAVGSKYGPRSNTWGIQVEKNLVIVTNRTFRKSFAFHWHLPRFEDGKPTDLLNQVWQLKRQGNTGIAGGDSPATPYVLRGRAKEFTNGYVVSLRILFPNSCLRPASDPDEALEANLWLSRPPEESGAVQMMLVLCSVRELSDPLPAGFGPMTDPPIFYKINSDFVLLVVWKSINQLPPRVQAFLDSLPRSGVVLDSPERRNIFWGQDPADGSLDALEHAVD